MSPTSTKRDRATKTGGRAATEGVIRGEFALSVGDPRTPTPAGWRWTRLTDVARLETGHTPTRKRPEYWDGDVPWIGIKDATTNHGRTIYETFQWTNQLGLDNSSARLLPAGTVCLSRTASVGYVLVMGRPMATSQDFVNWVCSEYIDHRFLKYVLLAEDEAFLRFASGTTHQTIYFPEVKAFHVCLPPLAVQRKIADVLSSIDDLIENNRRRIEVLEEMARLIYREWFVHFRFPGHEDVELVDSNLGPIPRGWEVTCLGDLAQIEKGLSYKGAHLNDDGPPMANLKCLAPGGGFRRDGTKPYDGPYKERHAVTAGDIVVANTDLTQAGNVIGSAARVPSSMFEDGGLLSHHLFRVRLRAVEPTGPEYLLSALQDRRFHQWARACASGTTVLGFRREDAERYPVLIPDGITAGRFEEAARPIRQLAENLEDQTEVLAATRDSLLPRLISGELDVSDLELDLDSVA